MLSGKVAVIGSGDMAGYARPLSAQEFDSFRESDGCYYDVNFFQYHPSRLSQDSRPSSYLFRQMMEQLEVGEQGLRFALDVRRQCGINKSLWGLRNEGGIYSLEFYFYYQHKYPCNAPLNVISIARSYFPPGMEVAVDQDMKDCYLTSVNLDGGVVSDINVYRSFIAEGDVPLAYEDKGLIVGRENPVFSSFSLVDSCGEIVRKNTYYGYFAGNSLAAILKRVHELVTIRFPGEDPFVAFQFLSYAGHYLRGGLFGRMLVALKEDAVGVYFLDLDLDQFVAFLETHDHDKALVGILNRDRRFYEHIKFDVGMDFRIVNGKFAIKKTAFWGSF